MASGNVAGTNTRRSYLDKLEAQSNKWLGLSFVARRSSWRRLSPSPIVPVAQRQSSFDQPPRWFVFYVQVNRSCSRLWPAPIGFFVQQQFLRVPPPRLFFFQGLFFEPLGYSCKTPRMLLRLQRFPQLALLVEYVPPSGTELH